MTPEALNLIEDIKATCFHGNAADQWDQIFEKLFGLLRSADPQIADFAGERIAKAIWSEQSDARRDPEGVYSKPEARLEMALPLLAQRADIIDRLTLFVADVEQMAGDDGFRGAFLNWIENHRPRPEAVQLWSEAALAYRIRLRGMGNDWETASGALIDFLKHPSLHVRASAARGLGELYSESEIESPTLAELMEMIGREEIEHPGIAGPFYGNITYDLDRLPGDGEAYVRTWMLSILKARKAPEPPLLDYHFNGIDFHAHELFAGHPHDIRKLMGAGRFDIAVMAATEDRDVVEGLEAILIELANNADDEICRLASWHLAYHYRCLHSKGSDRGFVSRWPMPDGAEVFLNTTRPDRGHAYSAVIYPPVGQAFTEEEARRWLERLLPENNQGNPVPFGEELYVEQTSDGGMILGNSVYYSWTSGAIANFNGDVAQRQWQSVTIIWHGAERTWTPEDYLSEQIQREEP